MSGIGKSVETKSSLVVAKILKEAEMGVTVNDGTECLWGHENVLKVDGGGVCTSL